MTHHFCQHFNNEVSVQEIVFLAASFVILLHHSMVFSDVFRLKTDWYLNIKNFIPLKRGKGGERVFRRGGKLLEKRLRTSAPKICGND